MDINKSITLSNGVKMPQLGFGVWQVNNEQVSSAVTAAIENGYRSIDTAKIYENEVGTGEGIKNSGIKRGDIFITTKVWNDEQGYDNTLKAFDDSLKRLSLDYVDLYLIHWPVKNAALAADTWRAMERIYMDKRARAVGVSNFNPKQLESLKSAANLMPMVNQVQISPYNTQVELRSYCKAENIAVEAYSPLNRGGAILSDPLIAKIARKHKKTAAQVILRWHLQQDIIIIPKSVKAERIKQNADIFDFTLSDDELDSISSLDRGNVRNKFFKFDDDGYIIG